MGVSMPGWMGGESGGVDPAGDRAGVDSGVVRRAGGAHPGGGGAELRGPFLTYRELEEAANRLAHLLADHGVGPGAVCGAAVFPFG